MFQTLLVIPHLGLLVSGELLLKELILNSFQSLLDFLMVFINLIQLTSRAALSLPYSQIFILFVFLLLPLQKNKSYHLSLKVSLIF